ncbi:MAG: hypothetical protein GF355_12485 [Candidatus Eisenbacteria bacterium]|nr:hypothetical protein [Candidatus Eisenbacteria bacterium]
MENRRRDPALRRVYSDLALRQIPRLLSLTDREEFSPTYGCMDREYWLCRTTDFPSAIAQFGVQSLALVYAHDFPDNPYYRQPKILLAVLAAMDYWTRIQKDDGSFDEFYPNERGWAGPTGFLVYAMARSYRAIRGQVPKHLEDRFLLCMSRAAHFLGRYDEPGVLANHHAMAVLPIYEAYDILRERSLLDGFQARLQEFLRYADEEEGWCLEYDGPDIGYLSATVSFLAKLGRLHDDRRVERVIQRAIEFCSYFVYPNGFFGGTVGSRQTVHFYPHGFELRAAANPTAAAVAEAMLRSLSEGKLVPPEIQEDRYFRYRIPELLEAYLDYQETDEPPAELPYERRPFQKHWPRARMVARRDAASYSVVNLGKGGVVKIFDTAARRLTVNDCGMRVLLRGGVEATTAWMDPDYRVVAEGERLEVEGRLHEVVHKVFTPWRMILFRMFMLVFGWRTSWAYRIKGWIRRLLMLRSGTVPVRFARRIEFGPEECLIADELQLEGKAAVVKAKLGDEFTPRYVPQSRYFQMQELDVVGAYLTDSDLEQLNRTRRLRIQRRFSYTEGFIGYRDEGEA